MYVCLCNAITEKMLEENSFLLAKIGSQCGKCIENGKVYDGAGMTYYKNTTDAKECIYIKNI